MIFNREIEKIYVDYWISQTNTQHDLLLDHIVQFANLWKMLQVIHLDPNMLDSILDAHKRWLLFFKVSLHHAILGAIELSHDIFSLEALGSMKCKHFFG
jgi:hypothetical protein